MGGRAGDRQRKRLESAVTRALTAATLVARAVAVDSIIVEKRYSETFIHLLGSLFLSMIVVLFIVGGAALCSCAARCCAASPWATLCIRLRRVRIRPW